MGTETVPGDQVPALYGLDIETDTAVGGLDPAVSRIIAVAVSTGERDVVFTGPESDLLHGLDALLAGLPSGVLVTWNGAAFDLPFIADRARACASPVGLVITPDPSLRTRTPLPGHLGSYRAHWHHHGHLDAYRVWGNDLKRLLDMSCSLKSVAQLLGLAATRVDTARVHELSRDELTAYVASDARLARAAALARWATAVPFLDPSVRPHPSARPSPATAAEATDRKAQRRDLDLLPSAP
jgi:DNA polymerase family B, exonuclease domain